MMSQIIVTSRYLRSGTKKTKSQRKNYTKYIATRETVELREQKKYSTENQEKLLQELLTDFPEAKKYLEYEDYQNNSTSENASELISAIIERNADVIGSRQNFVGYMAMRPGVEKRGTHGLFNEKDEPIVLDKVAQEIANHPGNVWSHVVSLRREDAIRLGYDNSDRWRELVMRHISDIAEQTKIPLCNLKWYGAFHDTTHHPHIHLIVYSTNPKQGFLTKQGIDKIRSVFANDIFHDDLQSIYQEQTIRRDELKMESKKYVENLLSEIESGRFSNPELEVLVQTLKVQLDRTSGKKVYGYLKPEVKKTVDEIFKLIAQDENISVLYEKWCELERQKYKTYTQKEKVFPPLWENKAFQPVRNMIIQQVMNMNFPALKIDDKDLEIDAENNFNSEVIMPEDFIFEPFIPDKYIGENSKNKFYIKWSNDYKSACKIINDKNSNAENYQQAEDMLLEIAESGNVLAMHELGRFYASEKFGKQDNEKSVHYYSEALKGFTELENSPKLSKLQPFIQYRIGKMFSYGLGVDKDLKKAFDWFRKSALQGNQYAEFSLGNAFYFGNGVEKDLKSALEWYEKSAQKGQPYAAFSAAKIYANGESCGQNSETAQKYYKSALSGFLKIEKDGQADDNLLYKLGFMFKNGLGTEADAEKAIEYFKQSAQLDNKNGLYEYGKALIHGKHIEADLEKGLECVEKAIKLGNSNAKRFLALEYISGEYLEKDIEKGLDMLTKCADSGDAFSCYKLGNLYLKGEIINHDLDKAEKYLLSAEDNEFTQYALGKLYLQEEKYDIQKTVNCFKKCADKNMWASYQLGRIYLFGAENLEKDKEKAMHFLNQSAEQGNEYAQNLLENMEQYQSEMLANTILGLFANLSRIIADDYNQKFNSARMSVDKKLRRMMQEKKQALGLKEEHIQNQEQSY